MREVSVVLLNYNRLNLTKKAVYHLLLSQDVDFELIVVDNNSHDGTREYLEGLADPRVKKVLNKRNLYFAGGNNSAIRYCSARSVLFTQNDMFFKPYSLRRLLDFKRSLPDSGCIGIGGGFVSSDSHLYEISDWWKRPPRAFDYIPVDFLSGCLLLLERSILTTKRVRFDPKYKLYWEDVDFCHQITGLRKPLYMVNNKVIGAEHLRSGTITPLLGEQERERIREQSHSYYMKKWSSFLHDRRKFQNSIDYNFLVSGTRLSVVPPRSTSRSSVVCEVRKAEFLEFSGKKKKAEREYRRVARINPKNFFALAGTLRMLSHHGESKDSGEILKLSNKCLSREALTSLGAPVRSTVTTAMLRIARRHADSRRYREAIFFYSKLHSVARSTKTKAVCEIERAKLRFLLGESARAEREMRRWLKRKRIRGLDKNMYAAAHFYLGEISREKGDEDAARFLYKRTLRLDPHHARARKRISQLR
ncbi:MAG: glycosyltransferase [Bdellovibrionales bacterium]|nr:glycosyltransferase [Bdellovibrionales bacterium]